MYQNNLYSPNKIMYISLSDIAAPPVYRCKWTEEDNELTRSIARYGVLLPISLRRTSSKFELVSGTRRFYASRRAGLHKIPALIIDVDTPEGELIAFTENFQRKTFDFVEEAEELHRLISIYGISREEASRRIGKSLSYVSNKLRLLNMPKELLYAARDLGLTERHVRALLRLSNSRTIAQVMKKIADDDMSVSETDKYIDSILHPQPDRIYAFSCTGLFLNTIEHSADIMRRSGYSVNILKSENTQNVTLNIVLSKLPSL